MIKLKKIPYLAEGIVRNSSVDSNRQKPESHRRVLFWMNIMHNELHLNLPKYLIPVKHEARLPKSSILGF